MSHNLPIKPMDAVAKLLEILPKRTRSVLEQRFGLAKNANRLTLDAIGKKYGITRERVRQIETDGFNRIKKSDTFAAIVGLFSSLDSYFAGKGKVIREDKILNELSSNSGNQNSVYFLLKLHSPARRIIENEELHTRWSSDPVADSTMSGVIKHAVAQLRVAGKPVVRAGLFDILKEASRNSAGEELSEGILENWLHISKTIAKNHFDEWGLVEFPEIKPRGVRDLSHIVLSKSGSPMHFSEVAGAIGNLIGKGAHVQTVHNELIKDDRFVLVGRGLYALKNWGYDVGTVKDIIGGILHKEGPQTKEKLIALVSAQRMVKPNTIIINLENKKFFKKLQDGRYAIR